MRLALLDAGREPTDQLDALTRAHVRVHIQHPLLTRVCNRELGALSDDDRDEILAVRVDAGRLFIDVVERGQRMGVFRAIDPMLVVTAIGSMGIRLSEWWQPDLGLSPDDVADAYADFALKLVA